MFAHLPDWKNSFILSIFSSSLFLVYPEIFCLYLIITFTFLISKFFKKNEINFKIILSSLLFYFIFTIASYDLNYKFLIIQFHQALNSNIDWWGYFGAFIFGKTSLVLDLNYVDNIKSSILDKNFFGLINRGFNVLFSTLILKSSIHHRMVIVVTTQ